MVRKWFVANLNIIPAAALFVLAAQAAAAVTIITPADGGIVREKVKIAIPQSAVPSGGFISVVIDGRFQASACIPPKSEANVTYIWNTKAQIDDPRGTLPEAERWVRDGQHEIEVLVHNALGVNIESKKISVRVANRVPVTNPAPPIVLRYKYRIGDITRYRVKVRGELLDSTGRDLLGGQTAFESDFVIGQWIEDTRGDGSALVRYKLVEAPKVSVMGQPIALTQLGQENMLIPSSIYKMIDKYGRTLDTNVITKGMSNTISDVMVTLPAGAVKVGHTWQSSERLKIEGLGELIKFTTNYQLDNLEYEKGMECAKITAKLASANVKFNLFQGFEADKSGITGNSDVFFAYRIGKVIKAHSVLEMNATIDANAVGNLANSSGQSVDMTSGPLLGQVEDESNPDEVGRGRRQAVPSNPYNPYGPSTGSSYGGQSGQPNSSMSPGSPRTSVKLRITTTMELRK